MRTKNLLLSLCLTLFASFAFAATADLNNPQGAVWNLRESGFTQEAQALENQIIEILKSADIKEVSPLSEKHTSKAYLVRFPGNIFAIMKEDDPLVKVSHRHDVASFLVDRAIGLNMVPITAARNIQGKNYSLQLYYPTVQGLNPETAGTDYVTAKYWDLIAFDDLIANKDREIRSLHNVLLGIDGRLIAIDHARTFQIDRYEQIMNGIHLEKVSPEFKQGFAQLNGAQLAQDLKGLLTAEQLQHLQEKRTEMAPELRTRPGFAPAVTASAKPALPSEFQVPAELKGKIFVDFFGIKVLLGPDSKNQPQAEINRLIDSHPDKEFIRRQAIEYWDYMSVETRARILPFFIADKDFVNYNSSLLQKILVLNPEFVFPMLANEQFRRYSFPYIARGVSRGQPEVSLNPTVRQLLVQHLVQGQLVNRAGFDFDELFSGAREDYKRVLLSEIYQGMVKAGLGDHVARIFRLQHYKNATLPVRIIESFPLKQRPLVQAQLLHSYEIFRSKGVADPKSEAYKVISGLIGTMRRIPLSTPMCEGLF